MEPFHFSAFYFRQLETHQRFQFYFEKTPGSPSFFQSELTMFALQIAKNNKWTKALIIRRTIY